MWNYKTYWNPTWDSVNSWKTAARIMKTWTAWRYMSQTIYFTIYGQDERPIKRVAIADWKD